MLEELPIAVVVIKTFATIPYVKVCHAKGYHPYQILL